MGRTNYNISQFPYIASMESTDFSMGYSIDWDNVSRTNADGVKELQAGTIVAKTANGVAERASNASPAIGILLESISEDQKERAINGQSVIVGGSIYQNLLPDIDNTNSGDTTDFDAWITELEDLPRGFHWETYSDNR